MRVYLFDIDGTLLKSRGRGLRAMRCAFEQVFGVATQPPDLLPHGRTDWQIFAELAGQWRVAPEKLEEHLDTLEAAYVAYLERFLKEPDALRVEPGVSKLLVQLAARDDVHLGLATGNLEASAWLKLRVAGLAGFFEDGGFGSRARERAEVVAMALQRFERTLGRPIDPGQVWVIGDTPADVASGKALGTRTLAVASGRHTVDELAASEPDGVVESLDATRAVLEILDDADGRHARRADAD